MRTPVLTPVFIFLTFSIYAVTLGFPRWMEVVNGDTHSEVGVLLYKITQCNSTDAVTNRTDETPEDVNDYQWMFTLKCHDGDLSDHAASVCDTYFRVSMARFAIHALAVLSLIHAFFHVMWGAGTKIRPFFLSLIFGTTAFVLFLASYDRARVCFHQLVFCDLVQDLTLFAKKKGLRLIHSKVSIWEVA